MRFTLALVAAALFALNVAAQDVIAWSGDSCNGDEGADVPCSGECISFDGRHSFEVSTDEFLVSEPILIGTS